MTNIQGKKVLLRAVEPSDIQLLYEWENDTDIWGVSGTTSPFSHHTLSLFVEAQQQDIFSSRQLRLIICTLGGEAVGALDIFEFDPFHQRAGVGIMVASEYQRCGYGADALLAAERYAVDYLRVRQLWCNIEEDNLASLALFSSLGYEQVGVKRDWNVRGEGYISEILLQKIL